MDTVRVDKWLWAARLFKTRAQAGAAVRGGKVAVNGDRAKPSKTLRVNDEVRVRKGPYEVHLVVRGLSDRRGPATEAAALYEETEESRQRREAIAEQLRLERSLMPAFDTGHKGRPTKRDRRLLDRWRRGGR